MFVVILPGGENNLRCEGGKRCQLRQLKCKILNGHLESIGLNRIVIYGIDLVEMILHTSLL